MTDSPTILVIEDSEAERFFLRRTISACLPTADVVEFAYAEAALRYLGSAACPDVLSIFVDINMPRMDGFAFADAFASLPPGRRRATRIWIVSHSIDPRDREQADAHPEIFGFLSKTYSTNDIARALEF
ncbi:MAG: response regulator [Pseudomonadota bacterium]